MRSRLLLYRLPMVILTAVLLNSCEPVLKESPDAPTQGVPAPGGSLTAPPSPCPACALAPTTFSRTDGLRKPYFVEFQGDPAADYLLMVQDDGIEGTGATITINGETVVKDVDLKSFTVQEVMKSVVLKAANRLTVLPSGRVGAKVTVWVLAGAEMIGPAGGTIVPEGTTSRVVVPSGFVSSGSLSIQAYNQAPSASPYPSAGDRSLHLSITPAAGTTLAGDSVRLQVAAGTVPAGYRAMVRVQLAGVPGDLWGFPEIGSPGVFDVPIPAGALAAHFLQASSIDLLVDPLLIEDGPQLSGVSPGAGARLGAFTYCPKVPVTVSTANPHFLGCGQFPSLRLERTGAPASGLVAIVLVHGWLTDVAQPIDLFLAQGLGCTPSYPNGQSTGAPLAFDCQDDPSLPRKLPAADYFSNLLPAISGAFPSAPIYSFTYASYDSFTASGASLASRLSAEAAAANLSGFVLVGHSMGGLVSREAAYQLSQSGQGGLVRGLVALATPHNGTEAATHQFLGALKAFRGLATAGGVSLISGLSGRAEEATLFAYAGKAQFSCRYNYIFIPGLWAIVPIPTCTSSPVFASPTYFFGGSALCLLDSQCTSDGIVPETSALGRGSLSNATERTFDGYDHSQMHDGHIPISGEPLHLSIIQDVASFLGAGPPGGGTWQRLPDHPAGFNWSGMGLVAANGHLVTIGGSIGYCLTTNQTWTAPFGSGGTLGSWTQQPNYVRTGNFDGQQVVVSGNDVIGVAGWDCGWYHNSVGAATVGSFGSTTPWTGSFFPRTQTGNASFARNGYIYAIGGLNVNCPGNALANATYATLNGTTVGSWQETTPLPAARNDAGVVAMADGRVFVMGGLNQGCAGPTNTIYMTTQASNGTLSSWTSAGTLPTTGIFRSGGAWLLSQSEILIALADPAGNAQLYKGTISNSTISSWSPLGGGPAPYFSYSYANGYLFAVGGLSKEVYSLKVP